jgi:hypothetical protein
MPQGSPSRRHHSRSRSRSRSRSPGRDIIMQPTMPSMYPAPVTAAPPVLAPGMMPMAPVPMMMPGGYSRSPSPRHPAPLIMQQGPHRRRSQSYSPRRRSYSPRYRRRSPPYERERDRSYDRDPHDRERPYDRDRHHGRRGYGPSRDESYSPSPLPRRRRPRSSDVSRSPSGYYAPTAPYPSMAPPPPSQYYSRRSPPYVEVIDIPQRPRRERSLSPTRPRRHSPSSREYDRSPPRDSRGRYLRRRLSPPDSRSLSPYTSPTRTRTRPLEEGAGPRGEEDRGGEMPPCRTTPRVGSPTPTSVPPRRAESVRLVLRPPFPFATQHQDSVRLVLRPRLQYHLATQHQESLRLVRP